MNIKKYWAVRNWHTIITITLAVALLYTYFPITFPKTEAVYYARENTLERLVKERQKEIHEDMWQEAELRALKEVYDELGVMVEDVNPYRTE